MFYFILVLLIIDSLLLATVVLLQAGQGGGLASLGGGATDTVLGGRQAVTLLTRMSWWCGGIFLGLALLLSVISANRGAGGSSLQDRLREGAAPPPATAPIPLQGAPTMDPAQPPAGSTADPQVQP